MLREEEGRLTRTEYWSAPNCLFSDEVVVKLI
jgi:hypothetical protein